MTSPQPAYRKVSRRRNALGGSSRLWLAEDHLLLVESTWWVETYRRFRLSEIQALVVSQRRGSWRGVQIMLTALTALLLGLAVWGSTSKTGRIVSGLFFGGALLIEVVDLARGRSCRVMLRTAVSTVRLPAITRMRAAERFLAAVGPAIEASQPVPEPLPRPGEPAPLPPPPPVAARRAANWKLHYLFFGCVLINGAGNLEFFTRWKPWPEVGSTLWMIALLAVVLGGYLLAAERERDWLLSRVLILICTCGIGADLILMVVAWVQMLAGVKSSDERAIREQLSHLPVWFTRYSWVQNEVQSALGALGAGVTWWAARRSRPGGGG